MKVIRVSTDVKDDRRVVVTLPPEVPTGPAELVITVTSEGANQAKPQRSSLAQWADEHAEHWGERFSAADVESFTGRSP